MLILPIAVPTHFGTWKTLRLCITYVRDGGTDFFFFREGLTKSSCHIAPSHKSRSRVLVGNHYESSAL